MTTFHLNTPEAQAARQAFKVAANEKRMALKHAPRVARPTKPTSVSNSTPRVPFKGAGKK